MLSHKLHALRHSLAQKLDHGTVTLSATEIESMHAVVARCATDAEQLEGQPAPRPFDPFRVQPLRLPPGVADLAAYRREQS